MLGSNWNKMPMANHKEEQLVFPPDLRFQPTQGEVNQEEQLILPPGYRFHPTDGEVIDDYLEKKIANPNLNTIAMGDVDLNKCEPWDLPSKAKMGEKEWYFFAQKDMKYPTGTRANRATERGYWKATGKDKEIFSFRTFGKPKKKVLVGMKKTLVFYMGRAPKGEKTNWVMHEFRLADDSSSKISARDEWVVCRVTEKKNVGSNNKRNQAAEPDTSNSNQPAETDPSNSYDDHDIMNILSDPASDLPLLVNSSDIPGSSNATACVEPSSAIPNMHMFQNLPGMPGFSTPSNPVHLPNNFSSRDNQLRVNQHWVDNQFGYGNFGFIQNQETDVSTFPTMYNNFYRYQ